ncbi:MAG: ATP-binding protein [Pseudomonadales bacterium]|nr:ATP-binding protein [Pseudomonadales bacterium]
MSKGTGIRKQLQILGLVPALFMLGLLLVALTWQRFEDADRDLRELGGFMAQQLASSSEYGVLAGNYSDLRRQARLAMQQADLQYVVFRDSDGEVLLYEGRGRQAEGQEIIEFESGIYRQPVTGNDDLNMAPEASEQPTRIGEVVLGMSSARLLARQKEILLASLIPALSAIILGLWIAHYLARQINSPLNYLSGLLRTLRHGDYQVRGNSRLHGELAELQDDINELAGSLESAHRDQQLAMEKLRQAHHQAQSASQAKSDFLAMMSHELRTPMNGVLGMLQLLEATPQSDEQHEYTLAALESTGHLLDVINDILDFSRIEAGRMDLDPVFFELPPLLESCIGTFRYVAESKGLYLNLEIPDSLSGRVVRSDPTRLRQVLNNLLSNAVKFTQEGGVTLTVSVASVRDDWLDLGIAVRDTGIGIPEDRQSALFKAFSQVDSSTSRRYGGTGLGLAIARRLSEMLGGTLTVSSSEGGGSTFTLTLRLLYREQQDDKEPAYPLLEADTLPSLHGLVLLVEDNDVNRMVARRILEQMGIAVVTAVNGSEGLAQARQRDFDCILMDVQMPVMDGLEATRELRRWEREKGRAPMPVVALTANAMDEERERCFAAGMNAHLAKPFRRQQLTRVLSPYLTPERAQPAR